MANVLIFGTIPMALMGPTGDTTLTVSPTIHAEPQSEFFTENHPGLFNDLRFALAGRRPALASP